jgi:peptide/nickel transport system permease protein
VLPNFLVALLVVTLFGPSLGLLCLVLGLLSWTGLARMVRAETVVQRHREHVIAARALGGTPWWIMRRHILPAAARPALAVIAPVATSAILAEAGLGYLGLSDPRVISWGDLIRNGQTFYAHGWWLSLFPGLAIVLTCLAIALISEGLKQFRRGN